ncbi:hypothetical protein EMPG_10846 [Blastomyces silverae]|uniref:Uncharacterized protein n=1 Tax=Blastomyces silverae TaxID=2060906 RepID=A0A0H1B8W8_9EURO|nr:hypothetical protein EMPG_10846 [Blastomyces silverae]
MGANAVTDIEIGSVGKRPKQRYEQKRTPDEDIENNRSFITKWQRFTAKYGVEQSGIELLGLRQMVLPRFYFGYYGVKLGLFLILCYPYISFLPEILTLACLSWSAITVMVGAQLIHVGNGDVPVWVAIVIISSASLIGSLFGYRIIHIYKSYCWISTMIVFMVVLRSFAHSGDFENLPMRTGTSEAVLVLSFSSAVFGFATAWSTVSSDY